MFILRKDAAFPPSQRRGESQPAPELLERFSKSEDWMRFPLSSGERAGVRGNAPAQKARSPIPMTTQTRRSALRRELFFPRQEFSAAAAHLTYGRPVEEPPLAPLGFVGFNESEQMVPTAWPGSSVRNGRTGAPGSTMTPVRPRPAGIFWRSADLEIGVPRTEILPCLPMAGRLACEALEQKLKPLRRTIACRLTTQRLKVL